ncbi:Flocculation suppression protein [Saxophila tyrrhenica]|uniref:Flocculation suppression protein n=1 Tax=Saxophila tyrrhenica TaxID=1690608 RepID=A0AAV9P923_9PEZI|nr:Flocculation suppression protein [Saxophila tyrrhenica]
MASVGQPLSRSPFLGNSSGFSQPPFSKTIPILPSSATTSTSPGDPMDTSHNNTPSMGPPLSSPNGERHDHFDQQQSSANGGSSQPTGAAAAAQQPKVVQTAFIHKLYNMLEDQSIQHLISWSQTNESFVMSPSSEFSKVLAQYFKHTNISSFVRQLNMYGFHKVSDVFHNGQPDSPLWEFKHGAGNFKRGDLVGLREIKRRASRHALIHRDSFSNQSKVPPVPQQPGTPMEAPQDPVEARFGMLEWQMQDMFNRLSRTEEAYTAVTAKCQTLLEGLTRCHQWNNDLSSHLLTLVPDPDNPVHREVYAMRQDIQRHVDHLRSVEDTSEPIFGNRQSYFQNDRLAPDMGPPMSPRQRPYDESRRPSLQAIGRPNSFRTPVPPHLMSPRRYGSIGAASGAYSPSSTRPPHLPPPPPPSQQTQHPLANTSSPPASLARRHTSADIRVHGWSATQPYPHNSSPYASGHSSTAWPSSPRQPAQPGDQQLRDALAQYELPRAAGIASTSRHPSPPPPHDPGPPSFTSSFGGSYANPNDAGWQLPGRAYPFKGIGIETPGPPTRRSSMASNVHSLLNPADTAEREGEDEGVEERKRKRVL